LLRLIKSFFARFLPVPAKSAHKLQHDLLVKLESLDSSIKILEKQVRDVERSEKIAAQHFSKHLFNIENQVFTIAKSEEIMSVCLNNIEMQVKRLEDIEKQTEQLNGIEKKLLIDSESQIQKLTSQLQSIENKTLRIQQQPRLSYFVLNILDHCNLNCKGCDHFSPLAEKRFVKLQTIQDDLRQMSLLTEGAVTRIGIMGGEPLLHPELLDILTSAREAFPKTLLQLVSNGILLLRKEDSFWDTCSSNNINIVVTKYPLNLDYERMREIANDKGVKFSFYGNTGVMARTLYKMPMDVDGFQDAKKSFWNCYHVNSCPLVMEGKLYPCTVLPNAVHFNRKFSTHMDIERGDYLDIYSAKSSGEILAFLSIPKPFCRYCKTKERDFGHPWERSNRDISEWT